MRNEAIWSSFNDPEFKIRNSLCRCTRTKTLCAAGALKECRKEHSMTFREEDRSIGAFRRAGSIAGMPKRYGACQACGGVFLKEFYAVGFGSRTGPSTGYVEEQKALRESFSRTSNRCTCDPDGDRLFEQNKSKNVSPPQIIKRPTLRNTSADLKILDDLLNRGVLTRDQYDVAKRKLLSSYPFSSSATELIWRRAKELLDKFTNGLRR